MRRNMYRWFWAWDFEREEQWLNKMASMGCALVSVGFCRYTFEDCKPGEYTVRLEMFESWPSSYESTRYIGFVEETGAEYIGSFARWGYFRKRCELGTFDLFSDADSKIGHFNRLLALFIPLGIAEFCIGLSNFLQYFVRGHEISLVGASLCTFAGLLFIYGTARILYAKHKLKKQRRLFE